MINKTIIFTVILLLLQLNIYPYDLEEIAQEKAEIMTTIEKLTQKEASIIAEQEQLALETTTAKAEQEKLIRETEQETIDLEAAQKEQLAQQIAAQAEQQQTDAERELALRQAQDDQKIEEEEKKLEAEEEKREKEELEKIRAFEKAQQDEQRKEQEREKKERAKEKLQEQKARKQEKKIIKKEKVKPVAPGVKKITKKKQVKPKIPETKKITKKEKVAPKVPELAPKTQILRQAPVLVKTSTSRQDEREPDVPDAKLEKIPVPKPKGIPMPPPPKEIKFKKTDVPKKKIYLKEEDLLEYIHELGTAAGLKNIIKILKEECPKDKIAAILEKFITKKDYDFTRKQKLKTILALGKYYKNNKKIQKQIFDIIAKHKDIEKGPVPLLFLTVEVGQRNIIPDLITWYKGQAKPELKELAKQTLEYAAKNDYHIALKKLHESGAKIDKKYATKLLWVLIKSNAGAKSIEFLHSLGANLDSYDSKSKYTILIQAIKNKNTKIIKELVRLGADVKKPSQDKKIGYPLQITRELDLLDVEALLRSKGARD